MTTKKIVKKIENSYVEFLSKLVGLVDLLNDSDIQNQNGHVGS